MAHREAMAGAQQDLAALDAAGGGRQRSASGHRSRCSSRHRMVQQLQAAVSHLLW